MYKMATTIVFISFHLPSSLKGRIHLPNGRHQSVLIDMIGIVGLTSVRAKDTSITNELRNAPNSSTAVEIVIWLRAEGYTINDPGLKKRIICSFINSFRT